MDIKYILHTSICATATSIKLTGQNDVTDSRVLNRQMGFDTVSVYVHPIKDLKY